MAKKRPPGRPTVAIKQVPIYALRGVPEFKDWLDGFASHCGLMISDTIRQSLIEYAKLRDYDPPPKR